MNKKIIIVAYYSPPELNEERIVSPAAIAKLKYLISVMVRNGYIVEVLSNSNTTGKATYRAKYHKIDNNYSVRTFISKKYKTRVGRFISNCLNKIHFYCYILTKVPRKSLVFVYHSPNYLTILNILKNIKKVKLVLEVEEIYARVKGDIKLDKREMKIFSKADSFLFPTESLNQMINKSIKPYCIVYGPYFYLDKTKQAKDDKVHCVYAGTFDLIKGGCIMAINAALNLPKEYVIHILGFGTKNDEKTIINRINEVNSVSLCKVIFEGMKTGAEFIEFLKNCEIGLSTQNPNLLYNDSSFPSKVLTYMGNGLKVVSSKISVLEKSKLAPYIYFYDGESDISNVIKNAHANSFSSNVIIKKMDEECDLEIKRILD